MTNSNTAAPRFRVGRRQLTVIGAFDGVPGDTIPGNSNYDLPVEWVADGQISIH